MRSARVRFKLRGMAAAQQFSGPTRRGNSGTLTLFAERPLPGEAMKRMLAVFAVSLLAACAAPQTREQGLAGRAVDAMGGQERLAAVKTAWAKGTIKQWEPEQSEVPGGEM